MKTKMVFVCEHCKREYEYAGGALECEAKHFGLTLEEYEEYLALLRTEKDFAIYVSIAKNEHSEKLHDEAINAVIKFRKEHNFTDNR